MKITRQSVVESLKNLFWVFVWICIIASFVTLGIEIFSKKTPDKSVSNNYEPYNYNPYARYENSSGGSGYSSYSEEPNEAYNESEEEKYPDDTYSGTVDYYNPNTGNRSTYTLDINIESNQVKGINFPKGYLNTDHFDPVELNDDGIATVIDDRGREFEISLDE